MYNQIIVFILCILDKILFTINFINEIFTNDRTTYFVNGWTLIANFVSYVSKNNQFGV